jgi:hypothetical protein
VKPERLEVPHRATGGALGVAFVEVVRSEFVIGTAIAHDVVRDFENVATNRDDRLLVAALAFDAPAPSWSALVSFSPASSKTLQRRFTSWLRSRTCCSR